MCKMPKYLLNYLKSQYAEQISIIAVYICVQGSTWVQQWWSPHREQRVSSTWLWPLTVAASPPVTAHALPTHHGVLTWLLCASTAYTRYSHQLGIECRMKHWWKCLKFVWPSLVAFFPFHLVFPPCPAAKPGEAACPSQRVSLPAAKGSAAEVCSVPHQWTPTADPSNSTATHRWNPL